MPLIGQNWLLIGQYWLLIGPLQSASPDKEFPPPELFSHCLVSGHKLYGMIYKPHNAVPGVRYNAGL